MSDQSQTIEISDPSALSANPLVSVYTLAYKHEKFIAQAIEGVIAQQCDFPIELIIGEDCSPDATREIALDYQRRHPRLIRVLTAERNVGAYANARRCQMAARGKYIAICEGDDYWHHPHKLQMQVDLMSSNPEMVCCHTDFDRKTRFRTRHNVHKTQSRRWLAQGNAYIALLYEWSVMTATSMIRRDIMTSFIGSAFDNPSWPFGDYNRLLFSSLNGTFGYIDVSTATFRKVRNSAGNSGEQAHLRMKLAAEECVLMFLAVQPVDAETEQQILVRLKEKIYDAALYAKRTDLMNLCDVWFKKQKIKRSKMFHQFRTWLVKTEFPIFVICAIRNFVDRHLSSIPP
jgi:glycosyltransferase involved in cell wall biosynthesis